MHLVGTTPLPLFGVRGPINLDLVKVLLIPAVIGTFMMRDRGLIFAVLIGPVPITAKALAVMGRAGVTYVPDFVAIAAPLLAAGAVSALLLTGYVVSERMVGI